MKYGRKSKSAKIVGMRWRRGECVFTLLWTYYLDEGKKKEVKKNIKHLVYASVQCNGFEWNEVATKTPLIVLPAPVFIGTVRNSVLRFFMLLYKYLYIARYDLLFTRKIFSLRFFFLFCSPSDFVSIYVGMDVSGKREKERKYTQKYLKLVERQSPSVIISVYLMRRYLY